jgi:hypothetical protein
VTTVTITATNSCSTVSCSFTITVTDSQLPVVTRPPANSKYIGIKATGTVTDSDPDIDSSSKSWRRIIPVV